MTGKVSIFDDEERTMAAADALLDQYSADVPAAAYAALLERYKKLYRQSIRLVKMGDRMQGQLTRLYEQLMKSEEKYRSIFERSIQGVYRSTVEGRFLDINPAMARIFGYDSTEDMLRQVRDIAEDVYLSPAHRRGLIQALQNRGELKDYPLQLRRGNGESIWVEVCTKGVFDDSGKLIELEGLVIDVTERRRLLKDLKKLARVDGLTGLWNRRYFIELGQREVARAKRENRPLSMVYFDVDNFKRINDAYGHQAGDQVLREMAALGRENLRELDIFGRMGGDEFAIILPETTERDAMRVAERVRTSFAAHAVSLPQGVVRFAASFGVAPFRPEIPCLSTLIKYADQALYQAKYEGRNTVSRLGRAGRG
ncbi:MAG: sensor domain-containing diguanylate cyclase [Pseudomonadota bacterium]